MNARPKYVVKREQTDIPMCLDTLELLTKMNPGGVNQFEMKDEMFIVMRRDDFEHLLTVAGVDIEQTPPESEG